MNGGACGDIDLIIDFDGNIISKGKVCSDGRMCDIIGFAHGFEKFKEEFMNYVNETFK